MSDSTIIPADAKKIGLIATMVELLDVGGYPSIRSRLTTMKPTPRVEGTKSTEQPDVFTDAAPKRRSVLIETVTMKDFGDQERLKRRLYLFYTASESFGWEFQLACYSPVREALARFCARNGVRYSKIWSI